MEARKPKYSLFPAPPLSKPLPPVRNPSPTPEESLPPDTKDPKTSQESSAPPPAASLPPASQDQLASPKPSRLSHDEAPRPQEEPSSEPDSLISPSEMTASSFSTASETSLKPAHSSVPWPADQPRKRPRRAFVRHGLGGAGNYHKRPDSSPNSEYSGFLSALFGNKKRKTQQYHEGDSTECSQYSNQALPLGAAEVLKRKMLGQAFGGKRSTSSDRS